MEFASELSAWADAAPTLPPQAVALTWNEFLNDLCAKLAKISACAQMNSTLEAIDTHLHTYGDQMSQEEYDNWNEQGEAMWEDMVKMGC